MTDPHAPTVRQANAEDWDSVSALLVESGLPVDDLDAGNLDGFLVAESGSQIVGLIGLQQIGCIGLLRSLVVAKSARRLGLGGALVSALESASKSAGVTALWLLTIDADQFFVRHGFRVISRDSAPQSIQQTEEFSDLCPGTAFLMQKDLS
jgi:amino-acid N-acetyltransferase